MDGTGTDGGRLFLFLPPMTDPQALRRRMRARRLALTPAELRAASLRAAGRLISQSWFRRASRIGLYLGSRGELDPAPVMRAALAMRKRCCLPVLHPLRPGDLWFILWEPGDPLRPNRFGIPEPVPLQHRRIRPWALELVLVPLVAFDPEGHRLGMGGGYYDRTFAYRTRRSSWPGPLLVGYAHEFQCVPRLASQPWDVPMDWVVTDQRIYGPGAPAGR